MPRFNVREIENIRDIGDRRDAIEGILDGMDGPVLLSDLIARKNDYGGAVLSVLGAREHQALMYGSQDRTKYKIRVLCDEWGNKLGPGDKVVRKIYKPLKDKKGFPISPDDMSTAHLDGSFDERYKFVKEFEIDKYGCIDVYFEDAVSMLNINGLHAITRRTLSGKPEYSTKPLVTTNRCQQLHVHYWRYIEIPFENWSKLSTVPKRKGPLRGYAPKEEIDAWEEKLRIEKLENDAKLKAAARNKAENEVKKG